MKNQSYSVVALLLSTVFSIVTATKKNYAVIVDTSRTWRNYRHAANAIAIYEQVRRLGIPDSNIILMLGDDAACDSRNSRPGSLFRDVQIDYRCDQANLETFIKLLITGKGTSGPQLLSDMDSNVLVYVSGHGGADFSKFLDQLELTSRNLADVLELMWQRGRYKKLLFIIDSCKAATMFHKVSAPNVIGISSSGPNEDSISAGLDSYLGAHRADRFTQCIARLLGGLSPTDKKKTLGDILRFCPFYVCQSTVTMWSTLPANDDEDALLAAKQIPIVDFFGSTTTQLIGFD